MKVTHPARLALQHCKSVRGITSYAECIFKTHRAEAPHLMQGDAPVPAIAALEFTKYREYQHFHGSCRTYLEAFKIYPSLYISDTKTLVLTLVAAFALPI